MIETFFLNPASTVIGGIVLAIVLFLFREKFFPLRDISGKWNIRSHTKKTAYNPYQNMELRYIAMLMCEGTKISGTVEKVYENSSAGKLSYIGENRTLGEIDGSVKRYFLKSRVNLHITEHGQRRDSTTIHNLVVERYGQMSGSFSSTAADSEGEVTWQRDVF